MSEDKHKAKIKVALDQTLARLAIEALHSPESSQTPEVSAPSFSEDGEIGLSPALASVPVERRPKQATACERCSSAMWMIKPEDVSCYCRWMHTITWTTNDPQTILACDGVLLRE